jgi:hypothetical protein
MGEIPDYLAQYLAKRVLSDLPQSVSETLRSLTRDEVDALNRIAESLQDTGADPQTYVYIIH